MNLTQSIWSRGCKSRPTKAVNLSKLCSDMGIRIATLWTCHHHKARWKAELWLQSCIALGAARLEDNRLVIELTPDEIDAILIKCPPDSYFRNTTKE